VTSELRYSVGEGPPLIRDWVRGGRYVRCLQLGVTLVGFDLMLGVLRITSLGVSDSSLML
jgi:hypothetical protein